MARLTAALVLLALGAGVADAARVSDIRNTKHNLASTSTNSIKATSEDEVCVFCHTPHGATLKEGLTQTGAAIKAPLWNRSMQAGTQYTGYTSSSLDATDIQTGFNGQPGGSSKLCLSCHDGTIAIGQVNVLNGNFNISQTVPGLSQKMSEAASSVGSGTTTGFTRSLGTNLSNDHPISVTFTQGLSTRDTELRDLGVVATDQRFADAGGTLYIGVRSSGVKPKLPLEPTEPTTNKGQIQCATCHDPHVKEKDAAAIDVGKEKFLRLPRFQAAQPTGAFSGSDIICRVCHKKDATASGEYAYSAHANNQVATQQYTTAAANLRDFYDYSKGTPSATTTLKVWQASCLNCHDPHTVEGSRRLLREGTDSNNSSTTVKSGGNPAIEQTCYQCHSTTADNVLSLAASNTVPNIKSDFALDRHMPITAADQGDAEIHDIGSVGALGGASTGAACLAQTGNTNGCGADFVEAQQRLGVGALANRHVECTDCHNPHRVMKLRLFYARQSAGQTGDVAGGIGTRGATGTFSTPDGDPTHLHYEKEGFLHTNLASGVLRGAWGVEPVYGNNPSFDYMPPNSSAGYAVKRGHPTGDAGGWPPPDYTRTETYVTREYQICLKCHSNYGYSDNNSYSAPGTSGRPALGAPGTTSGAMGTSTTYDTTNGLTTYTNQAKEFQAPSTHRGEPLNLGSNGGAYTSYNTNNHRSWHPVIASTGRTLAARVITNKDTGANASWPWRQPWMDGASITRVGNQTMYCSDCHGSDTASVESVIPKNNSTTLTTYQNGDPWGPHGSANNFILKGVWGKGLGLTGSGDTDTPSITANFLCFKCHDKQTYAYGKDAGSQSGTRGSNATGFCCGSKGNLHQYHANKIKKMYCTWCHIAIPHGWKNKAFLVNLNDVGPEVGLSAGTQVRNGVHTTYTKPPYYLDAVLKVKNFAQSGSWQDGNCGSAGSPGNGETGRTWMRDGSESCNPPP